MPLQFDSSRYQRLESLTLQTSNAVSAGFGTDGGQPLLVEASAPGVFRISVGTPAASGKPASGSAARAAALHDLLARPEAIGDAAVEQADIGGRPGFRIVQGDHVLEITTAPLAFALYRKGAKVLASTVDEALLPVGTEDAAAPQSWTLAFDLEDDEAVYGLGESLAALDRRGAQIASDDPAARALPLAWGARGWGIHVNTVEPVLHDVGSDVAPCSYVLTIADAQLDVFLFVGEPAEILNQYTQLTGRAGQPTLWGMGGWLHQAAGTTVQQLAEAAAGLRERGVPFDAVSLQPPAAWEMRGKLALEWDGDRFPDPRAALALFKKIDVKVCAPGFPGVTQQSPMFAELEDKGWLLTDDDSGEAHVFGGVPATAGQSFGLLDLTHRDVWSFWRDKVRQMLDEGVDAVSCDVAIDIPDGVSARNGDTGARLRSVYPMLAKRCLFEAAAWNKTPPEGVVWSSDLYPTVQRQPLQAPVAVPNTWEGLAASIRAALTAGASGVPTYVHDIGSPGSPRADMTPELYLRWLAASVFSANMRFHADAGLLPWEHGDEAFQHAQTLLNLRYRLIPYVLGVIEDAARTGLPVQRSMALSFPDDAEAHAYELQYLLGPALLVAPAVQPGGTVRVYLPKGEAWWDLSTGWRYEGGTTWEFECPLDRLPVFGREGHMLCLGPTAQHTGEFNSARILDEVWLFGMPVHNPSAMRNKIRVMQMQGSSYAKGLEGLKILPSEGLEVKRRGAEVRISRAR